MFSRHTFSLQTNCNNCKLDFAIWVIQTESILRELKIQYLSFEHFLSSLGPFDVTQMDLMETTLPWQHYTVDLLK